MEYNTFLASLILQHPQNTPASPKMRLDTLHKIQDDANRHSHHLLDYNIYCSHLPLIFCYIHPLSMKQHDNDKLKSSWRHHSPPPSTENLLAEVYAFESFLQTDDESLQLDDATIPQAQRIMSNLNHGSFGEPYPSTLRLRQFYTGLCYRNPMVFHRQLIPPLMSRAKDAACTYLNIYDKARNGFCFTSISPALFHVLDAIQFQPGSVILTTDLLYHSLTDTLAHVCSKYQLQWIQVETPHGGDPEAIYQKWQDTIENIIANGQKIQLAIMDHISSKPTVLVSKTRPCLTQFPSLLEPLSYFFHLFVAVSRKSNVSTLS
jgi:hypothetical protein